jgi:hypothetical protein
MTYNEIAEQQGLTRRIVIRDLTYAYRLLRGQIKREDV